MFCFTWGSHHYQCFALLCAKLISADWGNAFLYTQIYFCLTSQISFIPSFLIIVYWSYLYVFISVHIGSSMLQRLCIVVYSTVLAWEICSVLQIQFNGWKACVMWITTFFFFLFIDSYLGLYSYVNYVGKYTFFQKSTSGLSSKTKGSDDEAEDEDEDDLDQYRISPQKSKETPVTSGMEKLKGLTNGHIGTDVEGNLNIPSNMDQTKGEASSVSETKCPNS